MTICDIKNDFFNTLLKEETEKLKASCIEIKHNKKVMLLKQGAPSPNIIYVKKGYVKTYLENKNNIILSVVRTGEIVNVNEIFSNYAYFSAVTINETVVCNIEKNIISYFMKNNPRFLEQYFKLLNKNCTYNYNKFVCLTNHKMLERMAKGLLYLSAVYETEHFELLLSQKELGELTSMTDENVVRTLKELTRMKIINRNKKNIEILDKQKLQEIN